MDNLEIWRDINGYEGHYQVSNIGRVKSLARVVECRKNVLVNKKEKMLLDWNCGKGYRKVKLSKDSIEKSIRVHRLVAETFLGNTEAKSEVNHINGIKYDNRVENLEWCTSSENTKHALNNKLKISQKGSEHGMSKLTEKDVLEIREIGRSKGLKEVSKIYKVSESLISNVLLNKIWNHV
jgi:hypothetical protein